MLSNNVFPNEKWSYGEQPSTHILSSEGLNISIMAGLLTCSVAMPSRY